MKLNYILLNALVLGSTPLNALGTGNGKFGKESDPPHVLLEDGGSVLMEDGGMVILEEYGEGQENK